MPSPINYYAKPPAFTGNTVVEISVPSGKLIASDDLRSTPYFDVEPSFSINYGHGLDAWAKEFAARTNTAYAFVGNTSPRVTRRTDGLIQVAKPAWSEEPGPDFEDGEAIVATICTDLWATMLTDYQNWLDHGGPDVVRANTDYALEVFTVFDVTPGKYRWTVYSHADGFDRDILGRVTFAQLELIEAY